MSDFADLIMESFVEVVDELASEKKLKKSEFARLVWPGYTPANAARKWQYTRRTSPMTGNSQEVSLADAYRMADVLGQDPSYLLLKARVRAEEKVKADLANRKKEPASRAKALRHDENEAPKAAKPTRKKRRTISAI